MKTYDISSPNGAEPAGSAHTEPDRRQTGTIRLKKMICPFINKKKESVRTGPELDWTVTKRSVRPVQDQFKSVFFFWFVLCTYGGLI